MKLLHAFLLSKAKKEKKKEEKEIIILTLVKAHPVWKA